VELISGAGQATQTHALFASLLKPFFDSIGQTQPPQVIRRPFETGQLAPLDSGHSHRGSDGRSVCTLEDITTRAKRQA
jgi:hypothetical protein